jgi:hypothetical protein
VDGRAGVAVSRGSSSQLGQQQRQYAGGMRICLRLY